MQPQNPLRFLIPSSNYHRHPQLIYTISTLHNPTGITTSTAHRQDLLALAQRYDCPILEDNAYEGLNFEPVPAPIKASDSAGAIVPTTSANRSAWAKLFLRVNKCF